MGIDNLQDLSDEALAAEFRQVASTTVSNVSSIQNEFQRRATVKLIDATREISAQAQQLSAATNHLSAAVEQVRDSSFRLEKLTMRLIVISILLLVAAAPPAVEMLVRLIRELAQ